MRPMASSEPELAVYTCRSCGEYQLASAAPTCCAEPIHLVELGMVEKRSRVFSNGGRVNIYTHRSAEAVRRQFKLGLYTWTTDAVDVIDDLSEDKIQRLVRGRDDGDRGPIIVEGDE